MTLLERIEKIRAVGPQEVSTTVQQAKPSEEMGDFERIKGLVLQRVVDELASQFNEAAQGEDVPEQMRSDINDIVSSVLAEENKFVSRTDRNKIVDEIIDEIIGFGPINPLIKDPSISEIMVNGHKKVYVEREGKIELTGVSFRNNDHVLHVIEKIISPLGRRVDETSPMVDARLPDGSRVNVIIPPLAIKGPSITIRKFSEDPFKVEDLIGFGTLTHEMAEFLKACVAARLNLIVSGGTGSGKTTTLNVISSFIPDTERIVTIEDAAELQLHQDHVVTLECRPANIEGRGRITARDLVINSLRMRPDRIIVGEVRGGEALDMLQAMNTGHDGSITTAHANSPRDVLSRLETMVFMAGMDLPIRAIREQISSAINIIVHQSRMRDGTRKITQISEITGMEGDVITLQDIFLYEQTGIDEKSKVTGRFKPTGIVPSAMNVFKPRGINLPTDIFQDRSGLVTRRG